MTSIALVVFLIFAFVVSRSCAEMADVEDLKKLKSTDTGGTDEEHGDDITVADRVPGSTYRGIFMLCEGYNPTSRLYTTTSRSVYLYPSVTTNTCKITYVYGNSQFNHARLWKDFTGIDYYNERLYSCSTGQVSIIRQVGTTRTTLFSCPRPYEAHVVTFGI